MNYGTKDLLLAKAKLTPEKMSGAAGRDKGRKNKAFFFSHREKLTLTPSKFPSIMNRLFLPGYTGARTAYIGARINRLASGILKQAIFAAVVVLALGCAQAAQAQGPRFSHQTIYVTDLDRAANFYEKVMELKRISEPFHDGKHVWFRISEHGQLHVVSGAKEDVPHDISIHLAFSVPSMAAFTKHLDAMGIKYGNWAQNTKTPQLRPDKVQQIYLQDPDGYWIEVNDDKF